MFYIFALCHWFDGTIVDVCTLRALVRYSLANPQLNYLIKLLLVLWACFGSTAIAMKVTCTKLLCTLLACALPTFIGFHGSLTFPPYILCQVSVRIVSVRQCHLVPMSGMIPATSGPWRNRHATPGLFDGSPVRGTDRKWGDNLWNIMIDWKWEQCFQVLILPPQKKKNLASTSKNKLFEVTK